MNVYAAFSIVGGGGALASLLIAFAAFKTFTTITDGAMWAIAAMVAVPMAIALGVSAFIYLSHVASEHRREQARRLPPEDRLDDPGAFTAAN